MDRAESLSAETLRELLDYDPVTGVFRWKKARRNVVPGTVAGHVKKSGYRVICIFGHLYFAQRLAWLYVHGVWPCGEADHQNRQRGDNTISNLRDATRSQNQANAQLRSDSSSGYRGVSYFQRNKKWGAYLNFQGKRKWLGLFETAEAAHEAVVKCGRDLHGEFSSHDECKRAA